MMEIPPALAAFARGSGVSAASAAKDWKAAEGFAAMAIGALLRPIFATADFSKTRFGGGIGAEAWQPMLVAEIGRSVAERGGLGISASVFHSLITEQQAERSGAPQAARRQEGGPS